ncbi:oligosaccharide flippase family protein [Algoriphagus confluentis]|uniref:Oligosaccharide flippase family protein n=1 Tax=Algoriphagus confluentis TaxID=1697556 RepID=A0ABQ6PJT2_9BACT|nr:oligosaccharide flippase family protein [Algoriphagus confluentis]
MISAFQSKLFKETSFYTSINILDKVIPFFLMPIYTRIISKEEIGYFVLYQALVQLFFPILTLSLQNAVVLNFFNLKRKEFSEYFTSSLFFFLIAFLIISSLLIYYSDIFIALSGFVKIGFYFIIVIIFLKYLTELRQGLWRNQKKLKEYGVFTIIQTILRSLFSIGFVIYFNLGWEGILLGYFIGYLLMSIYSLLSFFKDGYLNFNSVFSTSYVKDAFKISYPLSLHSISAWSGTTINRVIINNVMGAKFTADFGVASTYNVISTVLFDALNKAYVPNLFERLSRGFDLPNQQLKGMIRFYNFSIIGVTLIISFAGYYSVGLLFGKEYLDTRIFIFPLTLASGFVGLYKIHVNFIFYSKKTLYVTLITLITAIINLPISLYLIFKFGLLGAAYSILLINFLYFILSLLISLNLRKKYGYY